MDLIKILLIKFNSTTMLITHASLHAGQESEWDLTTKSLLDCKKKFYMENVSLFNLVIKFTLIFPGTFIGVVTWKNRKPKKID